jgi:hypothetical protein
MDIGKERPAIVVEPIEHPFEPKPVPTEPAPAPMPREKPAEPKVPA